MLCNATICRSFARVPFLSRPGLSLFVFVLCVLTCARIAFAKTAGRGEYISENYEVLQLFSRSCYELKQLKSPRIFWIIVPGISFCDWIPTMVFSMILPFFVTCDLKDFKLQNCENTLIKYSRNKSDNYTVELPLTATSLQWPLFWRTVHIYLNFFSTSISPSVPRWPLRRDSTVGNSNFEKKLLFFNSFTSLKHTWNPNSPPPPPTRA